MKIRIYTDGSAKGNPGPGGAAAILKFKDLEKELVQGFGHTTNNRMELFAVIMALKALKRNDLHVEVYSDSKYVVDAINKGWLKDWEKKDFKKTKNPDLWKEYLKASQPFNIKFHWVKGHAGHPENERCDQLAVEAADQPDLPEDPGYK